MKFHKSEKIDEVLSVYPLQARHVRKLLQDTSHGQQCMESFSIAVCQAQETQQQENNQELFFKVSKQNHCLQYDCCSCFKFSVLVWQLRKDNVR